MVDVDPAGAEFGAGPFGVVPGDRGRGVPGGPVGVGLLEQRRPLGQLGRFLRRGGVVGAQLGGLALPSAHHNTIRARVATDAATSELFTSARSSPR